MDFSEKKHVPNPRATTNIFSKLLFWWIFPLFQKGAKQDLDIDDLHDILAEDHSGRLGQELSKAWDDQCKRAEKSKQKPKFYKALLKVYTKQYILTGVALALDEWVIRVGQTIFLQRLIASFTNGAPARDQYLYGTGVILTTLLHTLVLHPTAFGLSHIGMKCRVSCCSLLYRKALRLSKAAQGQTTIGQLVNLMSNDVNRFDINLLYLHYLYIGPIQSIIFTYLLWTEGEFGVSCLAGSGFVLFLIPIQYYIGKLFSIFRFQIAVRTDKRGQIMSEIIIAMRVIKMYAWEKPFSGMVDSLRRLEVEILKKTAYLRAFYLSLFISSSKLITYFTLLAFVFTGGELRSSNVFFMVTVYNIMRQLMVSFVPVAAAQIGELIVSMKRIEDFLLLNEQKPTESLKVFSRKQSQRRLSIMDTSVVMTNVHAQWTKERPTLEEISLNLRGDKLVMVIGPVGSGKTSFLHALISELPISKGKCVINGRTSYSCQEPWIFSGNLRQNILFGRDYDKGLYRDVVQVSALEEDLRQLPFGENTIVGERGVALSGGQKARVNLARALYQDADIYLLDDPLSAVDARVSRHIFEKCVRRYLKGKLRILVTHQLQYLPQADHIVVLNQGQILAQGTYHELVHKGIDFVSLMASETEEDLALKRKESVQRAKSMEVPVEAKLVTDDKPKAQKESMAGGSVTGRTYWEYFKSGDSYLGMFFLAFGFLLSQCLYSLSDYWLSYWTNASEKNLACDTNSSTISSYSGTMDFDYFSEESCDYDEDFYFYFYTGVVVAIFVVTKARAIYFFQYSMDISINIHNQMFNSMVRAPTKFFDENPSGRIMNRFTKDIGSMDELLPSAFFDALSIMILMVGIVVIVVISNYYVIIPAVILIIILMFIRRFFIKTARHMKRIEAVARSPVFTHLAATIQGLTTIRASHSEEILIEQFDGHQDIHSSAWYSFIAANRWFGIWLELISIVFLIFVTYGFMLLAGLQNFDSGQVGLAISSCLALTGTFQWGMRQTAETENLMTSVERALEYSKLTPEAPLESKPDKKPPTNWPSGGAIRFQSVSLAYEDKDVLKNLTFDVKAKEKIGIVGRTGAGKSSIIAGLFRMTEPRGDIFIDDICINHIGLHDLRKNISIIPQDPVLFSGTIRYNLDPFDQFEDPELWTVIEEVELKSAIPALDFEVADSGSNFSVGQRQLVCLARAVLRKNKIIIMDEATANVDPRTDSFIQTTIRETFADCTIITIAHRLHSVMDCDRILVLDHGVLKEYDHPYTLLQSPHGILSSMVANTGSASSQILKRVAQETFSGRRPSFQVNNVSTLHRASTQIDVIGSSSSEDGDNAEEEKRRLAAIEKILQQHSDSDESSDDDTIITNSRDSTAIQEIPGQTSIPEIKLQGDSDGSSVSEEHEVQLKSDGSDVSEEEHQAVGSDVDEQD